MVRQEAGSRRICMLTYQDHACHPIIRRQVRTLGEEGYSVFVLDQGAPGGEVLVATEAHVRIRPVKLETFSRLVWRMLRRIDEQRLGEAWWTIIYFVQLLLTGLRYTSSAVRQRADWYQAHDLETLVPALIAGKLRGGRVLYDAHELTSEQGDPTSLRKRIERWLEARVLPFTDQLVTPNQARADVYASRCKLRQPAVVVRNCPPSVEIARGDLLRRQLGLSHRARVVVYHGTLIDGRALDNLVLSASRYEDDIVLVVIGARTAYARDVLEPLARSIAPSRVHFVPFVEPERVLDYVASADLGVVIYKNINLNNYLCAPTKLYEYLMVGVPVVVSNFPEMVELLNQWPVGQSFDPEEPGSIAFAVNSFFRTRDQRQGELQAALAQARRQFTWERESRTLLSVFNGTSERERMARAATSPRSSW